MHLLDEQLKPLQVKYMYLETSSNVVSIGSISNCSSSSDWYCALDRVRENLINIIYTRLHLTCNNHYVNSRDTFTSHKKMIETLA